MYTTVFTAVQKMRSPVPTIVAWVFLCWTQDLHDLAKNWPSHLVGMGQYRLGLGWDGTSGFVTWKVEDDLNFAEFMKFYSIGINSNPCNPDTSSSPQPFLALYTHSTPFFLPVVSKKASPLGTLSRSERTCRRFKILNFARFLHLQIHILLIYI